MNQPQPPNSAPESAPADYRPPLSGPPPPPPTARRARSKSRRSGFLTGCIIVLVIAGLAGLAIMILAGTAAGLAGAVGRRDRAPFERIVEVPLVIEEGVSEKIAIIDVTGIIMSNVGYDGADANLIRTHLRHALEDPEVMAVVLDLDTPGGEITASDEIYQAVRQTADRKPVVACMRSVCASGGYYVAAGCDRIFANPMTLTGSIGVVVPQLVYHELLRKVGVKLQPYTSGALKDMLSGGVEREESEQQLIDAKIQELVNTSFARFAQVVAEGRDAYDSADAVMNAQFGDGRVMLGVQAHDYGLVDQLGYFDDAVKYAIAQAGLRRANVIRYRRAFRLSDIFMALSSDPPQLRLDTGLPREWSCLRPKNLYYLMPDLIQ